MLVRDIIAAKGNRVWTVPSQYSLREALDILVEKKIGVLLVENDKKENVGILSERDILRTCHEKPKDWFKSKVSDVMSRTLLTASAETDVKIVMEMMTRNRIRHIPVKLDGKITGLISIGDVVKARLDETETENQHMRTYINGSHC